MGRLWKRFLPDSLGGPGYEAKITIKGMCTEYSIGAIYSFFEMAKTGI